MVMLGFLLSNITTPGVKIHVYGLSLFFFKTHKDLVLIYTYDAQILTDGLHMMLTFELGAYNLGHKTQSAFILDQTLVKVPSVNHSPNLNSRPHLKEVHYENFTRIKTNLILSSYLSTA